MELEDNDENIMKSLLNKYGSNQFNTKPSTSSSTNFNECKNSFRENSFSDDDLINDVPLIDRLKAPKKSDIIEIDSSSSEEIAERIETQSKYSNLFYGEFCPEFIESNASNSDDLTNQSKPKNKKLKRTVSSCSVKSDKEMKLIEKELKKQQKAKEKEEKKLKMEQEKYLKTAIRSLEKNIQPDECIKLITVHVDTDLIKEEYGSKIVDVLESNGINYKMQSDLPNLISWTRKEQSLQDMVIVDKEVKEKNLLLILNLQYFLEHVENTTLLSHIETVCEIYNASQLTVAILRLHKYFSHLKKSTGDKEFKNLPRVARKDIEYAMAEVQLQTPIFFRNADNNDEIATIVLECTKAVAQIPYKLKKQEKYKQENEYFAGLNKDCVRVDKSGNGLSRLWQQALTMFPMARLETAEAIISQFPNPRSLFEAYNDLSKSEGEKLLQDIPVRRAAGPLAAMRRIGPELSKKVYNFFNLEENDVL